MGICSSKYERFQRFMAEKRHHGWAYPKEAASMANADNCTACVRWEGSSRFVSMFTQQGRKGVNQDSMTVWENFNGEKDTYFCAVFDGHGPLGHEVSQEVRQLLPSKICSLFKQSQVKGSHCTNRAYNKSQVKGSHCCNRAYNKKRKVDEEHDHNNPFFSSWKDNLIKSFEEVDEDLCDNVTLDTYCSGSTTVAIIKQGDNLVIANLGDSRAVLCTRDDNNKAIPVQLTVDLKPNVPNEEERIKSCEGRVFAMEEEPEVFRMWMPGNDCPGLSMARAFGDFCLKDFGLISTPDVFYRKLTDRDEFVVLASDGVWDVLSNSDVVDIVASAEERSLAARLLVDCAVRAWSYKYPNSKTDDCAAICLFFRNRTSLTKSMSEGGRFNESCRHFAVPYYSKNLKER